MRPGEQGTHRAGSSWSTDERQQHRTGGRGWARGTEGAGGQDTLCLHLSQLFSTGGPILQKEVVCSIELALRL